MYESAKKPTPPTERRSNRWMGDAQKAADAPPEKAVGLRDQPVHRDAPSPKAVRLHGKEVQQPVPFYYEQVEEAHPIDKVLAHGVSVVMKVKPDKVRETLDFINTKVESARRAYVCDIWAAKQYVVRAPMIRDIFMRLQARAEVDVFGTVGQSKFPDCCGGAGEEGHAWANDWAKETRILWLNPPVNNVYDCMYQIMKSKAKGIFVLPDWPEESWDQMMWPMAVRFYYYKPDAHLYEEAPYAGWGSYAVLLDGGSTMTGGHDLKNISSQDNSKMLVASVEQQRTSSARRRWRRQQGKQTK